MGVEEKLTVKELVQRFNLEILCGWEGLDRPLTVSDIYRPSLELAGIMKYYPAERLQILGKTELSFISELTKEVLHERLILILQKSTPCLCITGGGEAPSQLIETAENNGIPVLRTSMATSRFISKAVNFLESHLAPRTTVHGVLVDVYGVGVLLMGASGIGKSETALELVKRGHRLVADDAVEILQNAEDRLIGTAPDLIRHLLEIRGLGIINVMTLFGAGAVRDHKKISLVIRLEAWKAKRQYDRLGLDEERIQIIDATLPQLTIPVRPGRNLAVIIEVAAMNFRLKRMGFHAAQHFAERLKEALDEGDDLE